VITDLVRFANPIFAGEPSSMTGNNALARTPVVSSMHFHN
jgi:hypothetical protein